MSEQVEEQSEFDKVQSSINRRAEEAERQIQQILKDLVKDTAEIWQKQNDQNEADADADIFDREQHYMHISVGDSLIEYNPEYNGWQSSSY